MKILIVSSYDIGGAAKSCLRLYEGLLAKDVNCSLLLKRQTIHHRNVSLLKPISKKHPFLQSIKQKLHKVLFKFKLVNKIDSSNVVFLKNRPKGLELFSFPKSNYDITKSPLYEEADIINLHWVAGFLDYETFFKYNKKPVVWTLHDMHPFTGGEHYEEQLLGIDTDGNPIKRNKTDIEKRTTAVNKNYIFQALKNVENLTIVAPSKWLANEAKNSDAFSNRPIHWIPYGINPEIFKPRDRDYSRELFGIAKDKKVVLFVADSINNQRKGYGYIKMALEKIESKTVVLCAIGQKSEELTAIKNVIELGPIHDERLMSMVYSLADVFVIPSLMDNLPNTVLESLMCGTPVIGFPTGGIPDMVQHGKNGLLTENISARSMSNTLNDF